MCIRDRAALVWAPLIVSMALSGCKKSAEEAPEPVVSVQAEHPAVGLISEEIAADAILTPLAQAAIAPRISAPIVSELVQRGARVHKGQLLITLEAVSYTHLDVYKRQGNGRPWSSALTFSKS